MTSFTLEGYRFAEIDLRRTVRHALDVLDHHRPDHHRPAARAALAERRAEVAALVAGLDGFDEPIETVLPVAQAVWPLLLGARTDLEATGVLPPTASGTVASVAKGGGGVPKPLYDRIDVDLGGVVGDVQASRRHHGSAWQALCVWSAEVIDGLAADGHPIGLGSAGENVAVAGLDWASVVPGVELRLGTVRCRVMSYALPCSQNARWFSDRRFDRIHHDKGDLSRVYAVVLEPGEIVTGDAVELEP